MLSTSPTTAPNAEMRRIPEQDTAHINAGGATGTRTPDPLLAKRDTLSITDTTDHDATRQDAQQNVCATTTRDYTRQENSPNSSPALAELATLDQWVVSKLVEGRDKDGNRKYDKPPLKLSGDRLVGASHSNPLDWTTYAAAWDIVHNQTDGAEAVGFVFSEYDPYTGVDFDGCRDPKTGAIAAWAQTWIDRLHSYTEISQSGEGVKVWVRGKLPETIKWYLDRTLKHTGIEVYSRQRYFWMTGRHLAGTPATINDAQNVLEAMERDLAPPIKPKVPRTARALRAIGGDGLIARILRENELDSLLEAHGADLIYERGSSKYYSGLRGDQHTHTVTYIVSDAAGKPGQIGFSYSPNGKLNNVDYRQGFDYLNALEALEGKTWRDFVPERVKNSHLQEIHIPDPTQIEARRKDAQRKRDARKQAAADLRADVEARAAADRDMPACARRQLDIHLTIAGERGWHRASVARQAEMAGYSERWTQKANEYLVTHGYVRRDETSPTTTAIWTFLGSRSPVETSAAVHENAGRSPVLDLDPDLISIPDQASERPAAPDSLDTWAWQADEHGADELNGLDQAVLIAVLDGNCDPPATQPADRMAQVEAIEAMTDEQLRAWMAGFSPKPDAHQETETVSEVHKICDFDDTPGASYDPGASLPPPDPRAVPSWLRQVGDIGPMVRKVEEEVPAEKPQFAVFDDPEPEIRRPPTDPDKARRYYAIKAKAKKTTNAAQRRKLDLLAYGMEEWRPPGDAPPLTSKRAFYRLPASIGAQQAALFGGAT